MIPDFADKATMHRWLKANKHLLLTAKKAQMKHGDAVCLPNVLIGSTGQVEKAAANLELLNLTEFPVKVVINTTNIMDSHSDVHLPGLWKKSLSEAKVIYHLQEHKMQFDKIISDRVQVSVKTVTWKEIGYDWPGVTEALVFDSTIEKDRNPYMAEQYAKARVNNHSVGMRYVKIELAMDSEAKWDVEEKAVWDKYIDQIVNRDEVEDQGYFYAVTEAKVIEGSAVPVGSNFATPTLEIGKDIALPGAEEITPDEPLFGLKFLKN